ncbi:MAG: hypothetical protein JW795_11350 [Chitinivibrionales bacterium]|nr:hypothetical protein [Chitinivibrionales bacterium]
MLSTKSIRRYISNNVTREAGVLLCTGFAGFCLQGALFRELLTLFFGNELMIAIAMALWLLASGVGSFFGYRCTRFFAPQFCLALIAATLVSIGTLRFSPLLFAPGVMIPFPWMVLICCVSEVFIAGLTGAAFGCLNRTGGSAAGALRYGAENAGALAAACAVFILTVSAVSTIHLFTLGIAVSAAVMLFHRHRDARRRTILIPLVITGALCSCLVLSDSFTSAVKYGGLVDNLRIQVCSEGELARVVTGGDTTMLLNRSVYRSTAERQIMEQAVHLPASQRPALRTALIIHDKGHYDQLRKYPGCAIDVLETTPELSIGRGRIEAAQRFHPKVKYDLIVLGSNGPETIAANRYFTVSFFQRMARILAPGGVFSMTLPWSGPYIPQQQQQLYDCLRLTLQKVFSHVIIVPGDAHATFMASEALLTQPRKPAVAADYVTFFLLPSLNAEKMLAANKPISPAASVNTLNRPRAVYYSLHWWMKIHGISFATLIIIVGISLFFFVLHLRHWPGTLSIASSGFAVGNYSICILLLYQGIYGTLYTDLSLLLAGLLAGFVAGSFIRRFPASDAIIGLYCIASLLLILTLPTAAQPLFFLCHFCMGVLSSAQLVSRHSTPISILNTADCIGGVVGMALSATLFVPLLGIAGCGLCLMVIKIAIECTLHIGRFQRAGSSC